MVELEQRKRIRCFSAANSTCLIRNKVFEFRTHVARDRLRASAEFIRAQNFRISKLSVEQRRHRHHQLMVISLLFRLPANSRTSWPSPSSWIYHFSRIIRRRKHLILNRFHSLRHSGTCDSISCMPGILWNCRCTERTEKKGSASPFDHPLCLVFTFARISDGCEHFQ